MPRFRLRPVPWVLGGTGHTTIVGNVQAQTTKSLGSALLSGRGRTTLGGGFSYVTPPPVGDTWTVPDQSFQQGSGQTSDLKPTVPGSLVVGGFFDVAATGTALPAGMSLSDNGILSVGSATQTSVSNVKFGYTELNALPILALDSTVSATVPYVGTVFAMEGVVPSGRFLVSPDDSNLRSSVVNSWPDGSAKVLVVAGETAVSVGTKTINLRLNSASVAQGTALTTARINALVSTVAVNFSGTPQTLTLSGATPDCIWWQNSSVICARYRLSCGLGGLEAVIDIHAFKAGVSNRAFVEVTIENCKINTSLSSIPAPTNVSYAGATVSLNGTTIATQDDAVTQGTAPQLFYPTSTHEGLRAWYCCASITNGVVSVPSTAEEKAQLFGVEVTHDTASMQAHPMFQKIWKVSDQTLQSLYGTDAYDPWSWERINVPDMGQGGDKPGIGSLTQWDTRYLQSGNKYVRRASIANGLAALSCNINTRDTTSNLVPTLSQQGTKNFQNGYWPSVGGEPGFENAHSPALGLMAFLCRPSPIFIEVTQRIAVWQRAYGNYGELARYHQVRGKAWTVRAYNHALFLTPDASPHSAWKSAAQTILYNGLLTLEGFKNDPRAKLGSTWDFDLSYAEDMRSGGGFQFAVWEHHYLACELHKGALGKVLQAGTQQAKYDLIADWALAQPVRYVTESVAGEWHLTNYMTTIGRADGNGVIDPADTWGQQFAWQFTDAPPPLSGPWVTCGPGDIPTLWANRSARTNIASEPSYDSYFWAAFCFAVERGIAGADTAWTTVWGTNPASGSPNGNLTNLAAWGVGGGFEPRWCWLPRNKLTATAPSQSSYTTTFPLTENPISEGAGWTNGTVASNLWNNVKTVNSIACAANFANTLGSRYDDPIACLKTSVHAFTPNQYVEATVHRAVGYSPNQSVTKHEIELLLRWLISGTTARGYEFLIGHDGGCCWVRWNGARGSYQQLSAVAYPGVADGDVFRVEITGTTMNAYKNGAAIANQLYSDSTWADGQPGMGFWPVNDGVAPVLENYGWKDWQAGDL